MPNTYLEMAQQYPGLLANVGQQFQQAFFQGKQAKITEEQHKFEMGRQQKADERQNDLTVAQREMAAGRPNIMQQHFPVEYAAMQKQQMEMQNAQITQVKNASDAARLIRENDTKQRLDAASQMTAALDAAENDPNLVPMVGPQLAKMAQGLGIPMPRDASPEGLAALRKSVAGVQSMYTDHSKIDAHYRSALIANGINPDDPGSVYTAMRDPKLDIAGTARKIAQDEITTKSPEFELEKAKKSATQVIVGGNEAIEKGTKEDLEKKNLAAQSNLEDSAAIRSKLKTVDIGKYNSLLGGAGVRGSEWIEKLHPDLLSKDAAETLDKVKSVRAAIGEMSARRAAQAKQLRALGGGENSRAAELLESTVLNPNDDMSDLIAKLDASDEADKRVKELTAKTLRPVTKGGGVSVEPTKTAEPPKQALPQIPPEQLAKYKQARESGASVDQAKAAAGIR